MRIVITDMPGAVPLVLDNVEAVILAAQDGVGDGSAPCVASGRPEHLARLAATILVSVRRRLGERVFAAVIRSARESDAQYRDVTDSIRSEPSTTTKSVTSETGADDAPNHPDA